LVTPGPSQSPVVLTMLQAQHNVKINIMVRCHERGIARVERLIRGFGEVTAHGRVVIREDMAAIARRTRPWFLMVKEYFRW